MKDLLIMPATVNGNKEWRVYVNGEIIARFCDESYAIDYYTYLKGRI